MKYEDIAADSAGDDYSTGMPRASLDAAIKKNVLKDEKTIQSAPQTERVVKKRNNEDDVTLNSRFAKTIESGTGPGKMQNTARHRPTTSGDFWQQRNLFAKTGNH